MRNLVASSPDPCRYVWSNAWENAYESPYSLLMKFAWVNVIKSNQWAPALFGKRGPTGHRPKQDRSLLRMDWMHPSTATHDMPSGILRSFEFSHRLSTTLPLFTDSAVRFCELCLRQSFHSVFFQLEGLAVCPIHSRKLQSRCSQCSAVTPRYLLNYEALNLPFSCLNCRKPLSGSFSQSTFLPSPYQHALRWQRLQPWHEWCRTIAHRIKFTSSDYGIEMAPVVRQLTGGPSSGAIRFAVAHSLIRSPDAHGDIRLLSGFRLQRMNRNSIACTVHRDKRELTREGQALCGRRAVAKSIRRYILRQYLHNHRRCVRHAFQAQSAHRYSCDQAVWFVDYVCPIAQAYVRWFLSYRELGYFHSLWGDRVADREYNRKFAMWMDVESRPSFAWPILLHFHGEAALLELIIDHAVKCTERCRKANGSVEHTPDCIQTWYAICEMVPDPRMTSSYSEVYLHGASPEGRAAFMLGPDTSFARKLAQTDAELCRRMNNEFYERHFGPTLRRHARMTSARNAYKTSNDDPLATNQHAPPE